VRPYLKKITKAGLEGVAQEVECLTNKQKTLSSNPNTVKKRAVGMAQVVQHQPNNCEALSSNPDTNK
jgi:hypothetical protein